MTDKPNKPPRDFFPGKSSRTPAAPMRPVEPRKLPSHLSGEMVKIRVNKEGDYEKAGGLTRALVFEIDLARQRVAALYELEANLKNDPGLTPTARWEKIGEALRKATDTSNDRVGKAMADLLQGMDDAEAAINAAVRPNDASEARELRAVFRSLPERERTRWVEEILEQGGEPLKALASADYRLTGISDQLSKALKGVAGRRFAPEMVARLIEYQEAYNAGMQLRGVFHAAVAPIEKEVEKFSTSIEASRAARTRSTVAWDALNNPPKDGAA